MSQTPAACLILTLAVTATGVVAARRFVTVAGVQAGAAVNTLGVAQYGANIGQDFPVGVQGVAIVETGAAVATGDAVETDASGRAVPQDAGPIVGRALTSASDVGKNIEVLLIAN